jgi:hypothetical protein
VRGLVVGRGEAGDVAGLREGCIGCGCHDGWVGGDSGAGGKREKKWRREVKKTSSRKCYIVVLVCVGCVIKQFSRLWRWDAEAAANLGYSGVTEVCRLVARVASARSREVT